MAASAFNYFFQVHAAALLDATAFGLLSTWLARVTLIGAVATVVQFLSLDFALSERRFAGLLRVLGLASFAIVGGHVFLGYAMTPSLLGATSVVSGIALYAVLGQLQARLELGVVAMAVLAAAALRFSLPFAWPCETRAPAFYVSHASASFAGIVAAAAVVTLRRARRTHDAPAEAPQKARALRLGRPILLAFATVLFPVIDVLVISSTQDAATTGAFSRIQLASRVVFFAGTAALQILLPHQLHSTASGAPLPPFALRLQQRLTPGMIAAALILAALVDRLVIRAQGDERIWLYACCLAAALSVAILGRVNEFAARDRLGLAAMPVAGVVATSGASVLLASLSGHHVTRYTVGVLVGNALVLLGAHAVQMRSTPSTR